MRQVRNPYRGRFPAAIMAALLLLFASGCGARLTPEQAAEADALLRAGVAGPPVSAPAEVAPSDGAPATTQPSTGPAGPSVTTAAPGTPAGPTTPPPPGAPAAPATGQPADSPGPGPEVPGQTTAPSPATPGPAGNGGATDVGVTGEQIVVGNVTALTGPLVGGGREAVQGTQAYVQMVNDRGGVHGRRIHLEVRDDGLDPGRNRAAHLELADDVFAFVGSVSAGDQGAVTVIEERGIPDVGWALDPARNQSPWNWSPYPIPPPDMADVYGTQKVVELGGGSRAAVFWHDQATSKAVADAQAAAFELAGVEVVYRAEIPPTAPDYTGHVLQMRSRQVDIVYAAIQASEAARLGRSMNSQGMTALRWFNTSYTSDWFDLAGPAAEGTFNQIHFLPFLHEVGTHPALDEFVGSVRRYYPTANLSLFTLYGWAAAAMFVEALEASGPEATRSGLVGYLQGLHGFDAGGLLGPTDPANKVPPSCAIYVEARGGVWERLLPASGYECAPEGRQRVP